MTTSQPSLSRGCSSRKISRKRRFTRLRTTAVPTRRLTVIPTRLTREASTEAAADRARSGWRQTRPFSRTRAKSVPSRNRQDRRIRKRPRHSVAASKLVPWDPLLLVRLDSQQLAATSPAALENSPTVGRGHPLAKAVGSHALCLLGLPGALHRPDCLSFVHREGHRPLARPTLLPKAGGSRDRVTRSTHGMGERWVQIATLDYRQPARPGQA